MKKFNFHNNMWANFLKLFQNLVLVIGSYTRNGITLDGVRKIMFFFTKEYNERSVDRPTQWRLSTCQMWTPTNRKYTIRYRCGNLHIKYTPLHFRKCLLNNGNLCVFPPCAHCFHYPRAKDYIKKQFGTI